MPSKAQKNKARKAADAPDSTGGLQHDPRAKTWFKPGVSGNPSGRKPGTRNKLSEAFIVALNDDFATHGADVIRQVREERPADYLKIIAAIVPKELHLDTTALEDMSDDELLSALEDIKALGQVLKTH